MLMQVLEVILFLLVIAVLTAGLLVVAMKLLERREVAVVAPANVQDDSALQDTLNKLNEQIIALNKKNNMTENQLANLQKKPSENSVVLHTTTLRTADFAPYQYALKLLQEGTDLESIRRQFNLSRGEMDVLQALHIKDTHLRHIDSQI